MKYLILIVAFSAIFISCASKKQSDIAIMNVIAEQECSANKGEKISLYPNASNEEMLKVFEENIYEHTYVKHELNKPKLTNGIAQPNEETIAALKEIFTQENYNDIKKQIGKRIWAKADVKDISCHIDIIKARDKRELYKLKSKFSIGKPVYTKNGYALVTYYFKNGYSLVILKIRDGKWKEIYFALLGIS